MKILIAVPTYNEELVLEKNIKKLFDFCSLNLQDSEFVIVIANNNSTDATGAIADNLAERYQEVKHITINQKGKGLAVATAFNQYEADSYIFMDADLSTELSAVTSLIQGLEAGADVVVGSRFHKDSVVKRSVMRKFVSWCYRLFFKSLFRLEINDFPCGFKAINRTVRDKIVPNVQDTEFFWDTELLVLADKQGLTIKEIPINWSEVGEFGRKSKVNVVKTSFDYIKKSLLLRSRV